MADFYAYYPSAAASANPSVGTNGATAPIYSTEIGGIDGSGNLIPVSVDSSGNINSNIVSSALPTGASTEAKQDVGNTSLSSIDGKIVAVNTGAVVVSSSALPAGAATEATLTTMQAAISARLGGSLAPVAYDEIVQTYVGATDRLNTVTYKLATVIVKTLVFSYDGSDRLTGVVAT